MTATYSKKNILVTGVAGFLGSHLAEVLVANPANQVIGIDNFASGQRGNIEQLLTKSNFIFLKADINEPIDLKHWPELGRFHVGVQGVQEIYNLACPTSPKEFDQYKPATLLVNSLGMMHVLDLARTWQARVVHGSSSVVYGGREAGREFFVEDDWGHVNFNSPRACYDEGKRFAETICATYADMYKMDVRIARIFRTYGPRMRLRDGQMIPDFIVNALDGVDLIIYGDASFATSLCYVSDIVDGLVKLMSLSENPGPVNLGSDIDIPVSSVAQKIITMTESGAKVVFRDPLLFMSPLGLPDLHRAKDKLGWLPVVSLDDGLRQMIDYVRVYKSLLGPGDR